MALEPMQWIQVSSRSEGGKSIGFLELRLEPGLSSRFNGDVL